MQFDCRISHGAGQRRANVDLLKSVVRLRVPRWAARAGVVSDPLFCQTHSMSSGLHPSQGTSPFLLERSLKAVAPHMPEDWQAAARVLLSTSPILVRVVRRRKTKHGDHQFTGGFSIITVNASENRWQFILTLLHEVAHAHVAHRISPRVAPHGREWKAAFHQLLHAHGHLFPPELSVPVMDYARNPLYSTDSHPALAAALRQHDALDLRPMVQELAPGQRFSLDGKTVLVRERLLRKWFRCTTPDGSVLRVPAAARVHTLYSMPTGPSRDGP